jgi:RNA polymerase sigma factor (sigma-70 family)
MTTNHRNKVTQRRGVDDQEKMKASWEKFKSRYVNPSEHLANALEGFEKILLRQATPDKPLLDNSSEAQRMNYSLIAKDLSEYANDSTMRPLLRDFQQKLMARLGNLKKEAGIYNPPTMNELSDEQKVKLIQSQKGFVKNDEVALLTNILWHTEKFSVDSYSKMNVRYTDDRQPESIIDAIYEIFLRSVLRYDSDKGASFNTFFVNALKRHLFHRLSENFVGGRKLEIKTESLSIQGDADPLAQDSSGGAIDTCMLDDLRDALGACSERDRKMLEAFFIDGKSFTDIARSHDMSRQRVTQLVERISDKLRNELGGQSWSK